MKKFLLLIIPLFLAAICAVLFALSRPAVISNDDELISLARKEITNLADVENIEMSVAGKSTANNRSLFWIITGNEYQMHKYYPVETENLENGEYKFIKIYNGGHERAKDIYFEFFHSGYSFIINNPECKCIIIGDDKIPVTEIPFVYYCPFAPAEYYFLDEQGNHI